MAVDATEKPMLLIKKLWAASAPDLRHGVDGIGVQLRSTGLATLGLFLVEAGVALMVLKIVQGNRGIEL